MIPNLSLADGVVEIVGDNGAHYFAYVVDVNDPKDPFEMCGPAVQSSDDILITLRFENNWRPKEAFPLSRIRLPTKTVANNMANGYDCRMLAEGSDAEVWRSMKVGHECGFWKCAIKLIKDDFYGVTYDMNDQIHCKIDGKEFHEVVTKDKIRPINTNPYLTSNPFFKFFVEVPKHLLATDPNLFQSSPIHRNFKTALSLISVNYDDKSGRLLCIGFDVSDKFSAYRMAIKGAEVLADTHFRSVKFEAELRTQIELMVKQFKNLDEIIKIKENEFEILVRVDEQFMRYAIGYNGSNIKKVLQMPGVLSVDRVSDAEENIFRIIATNRNSLRVAKEMLQIQELVINVGSHLVPHIIGKKGSLVQNMTDKSGLISIKVKGDDPNDKLKTYVPFHLIGTQEAIENARLLIMFQINCLKETEQINKLLSPKRVDKRRSH